MAQDPSPGPSWVQAGPRSAAPPPPSQAVPGSAPACTQPPRSLHKELVMWADEDMLIRPPWGGYPFLISSGGG